MEKKGHRLNFGGTGWQPIETDKIGASLHLEVYEKKDPNYSFCEEGA